jgi:hypothetical protein
MDCLHLDDCSAPNGTKTYLICIDEYCVINNDYLPCFHLYFYYAKSTGADTWIFKLFKKKIKSHYFMVEIVAFFIK